jgi:hypothetical protein
MNKLGVFPKLKKKRQECRKYPGILEGFLGNHYFVAIGASQNKIFAL